MPFSTFVVLPGLPCLGKLGDMTWIKTVPFAEASDELRSAMEFQRALYPAEYFAPADPAEEESIVSSHSLIPEALKHAFAAFGVLLSPELPLSRRQHEMIATVVSATNKCSY